MRILCKEKERKLLVERPTDQQTAKTTKTIVVDLLSREILKMHEIKTYLQSSIECVHQSVYGM